MRTLLIFTLFICVSLTSLIVGLQSVADNFSNLNRGQAFHQNDLSEFYSPVDR